MRLSEATARRPSAPTVSVDARGRAVVIWRREDDAIRSALRAGPTSPWVRLPMTASSAGFQAPALSLGRSEAVAAWGERSGGRWRVAAAVLDVAAPRWRMEPSLPTTGPAAIAVGSGGGVAAAWSGSPGSGRSGPLQAARRLSGSGWEQPVALAAAAEAPDAAVAADGTAAVVWQEAGAGSRVLAALRVPAAPAWSGLDDLGDGSVPVPRIAVNASGDATATWLGRTRRP